MLPTATELEITQQVEIPDKLGRSPRATWSNRKQDQNVHRNR